MLKKLLIALTLFVCFVLLCTVMYVNSKSYQCTGPNDWTAEIEEYCMNR